MSIPFIYPAGLGPSAAATGSLTLPASGGSVAIPYTLGFGLLQAVSMVYRTTDTTGSHTLDIFVLVDGGDDGPAARTVMAAQTVSFTATAAANRTFTLAPGFTIQNASGMWVFIRNTGAATTTLACCPASTVAFNTCATATLAASDAAGVLAGSWTPGQACPLVSIRGGNFSFGGAAF
jgi:hypothetical protein